MNKFILILDTLINFFNKLNLNITTKLEQQKAKEAYKLFNQNKYIQNYIQHFYDNYEFTYIDYDCLNRCNSFDFTQIPETLKENFIDYIKDNYYLHYINEDYFTGFAASSYDNIYLTYNNEIYADFSLLKNKHNLPYKNSLDLFLKLEQIQAEAGYYPDIVYLDYYDNYYRDYTAPEEYNFLKAIHADDSRLLYYIDKLIDLNRNDEVYSYYDNPIIEAFTPAFIQKIADNLDVELTETELDSNFSLYMRYEIPTILKPEQLQMLNITDYQYTTYNTTIININVNIRAWLEAELAKGYGWADVKETKAA